MSGTEPPMVNHCKNNEQTDSLPNKLTEKQSNPYQDRVQNSLKTLSLPVWYRPNSSTKYSRWQRRESEKPSWRKDDRQTTPGSTFSSTPCSSYKRWSSVGRFPSPSHSNVSIKSLQTEASLSNYRKPYMGWKNQEEGSLICQTPAQRLAATTPNKFKMKDVIKNKIGSSEKINSMDKQNAQNSMGRKLPQSYLEKDKSMLNEEHNQHLNLTVEYDKNDEDGTVSLGPMTNINLSITAGKKTVKQEDNHVQDFSMTTEDLENKTDLLSKSHYRRKIQIEQPNIEQSPNHIIHDSIRQVTGAIVDYCNYSPGVRGESKSACLWVESSFVSSKP